MLRNLAVIVDFAYPEPCGSPLDTPFGMFAKDLEQEGIKIILTPLTGFTKSDSPIAKGWTVEGDSWRAAELPVAGCYNRVDWKPRFEDYCRVRRLFSESNTPFVNNSDFCAFARDKAISCQALAETGVPVPKTVYDRKSFLEALESWGSAYLKPRIGSSGRNILKIIVGPRWTIQTSDGVVSHVSSDRGTEWLLTAAAMEPMLLQQAVQAKTLRLSAYSIRSLLQRQRDGSWVSILPVARVAVDRPTANVARGATVVLGVEFIRELYRDKAQLVLDRIAELETKTTEALAALFGPKARLIVEVGLDIVVDGTGIPYLIEINDTPKGRLKTLLRQTANPLILDAHKRAISNPLLYLNDVLTTSTAN